MNLDDQLKETTSHINSMLTYVREGSSMSDESAHALTSLIRQAEMLRNAAVRSDREKLTLRHLSEKYSLSMERIREILNLEGDQLLAGSINQEGHQLLELAPLAITDVRGERIVETMRQKIASGYRPGITVIGPHVTVRFSGADKNHLQSVSMLVTSVIDTAVVDGGD